MEKLHATMSSEQFETGYWYATELKSFAQSLGLKGVSRLRKDQLEELIRLKLSGEVVRQMIELCIREGRLPQIPAARFNNFISDFLAADEGNRETACLAWEELKKQKLAKTFDAWKQSQH